MTAPERIYANLCMSPVGGHVLSGTFRLEPDEIAATQPYILATPEALASSPEVAALLAEARREGWNAAKEAAAKHVVELTHSIRLGCFLSADKETDLVLHPIGQCAAAIRALKEETP